MDYHRSDTAKKRSKPYTHLTAIQKKEICQRQRDNPIVIWQTSMEQEKSTMQDIIFQSKKWLAIDINETSTYCLKNKPPKMAKLRTSIMVMGDDNNFNELETEDNSDVEDIKIH